MNSISLDYIFNRVYDVLLWIKYVWVFDIMRKDPGIYLQEHESSVWDGLRDRGWFDAYLMSKNNPVPPADLHISLWGHFLEKLGFNLRDSDGDGIPDVSDSSPYDASNLTAAQLKERYQQDYSFMDHVRDVFGIGPRDSDKDGIPNSYESAHGLDPNNPDSDRDGVFDGQELIQQTDPLNNDTDSDGVLDGRDERPNDPSISSVTTDTDGDGVSDNLEKVIGTNPNVKDTDGDGIPDSMDTYALDPNNVGQIPTIDLSAHAKGITFSIQNPVLALVVDLISIVAVVFIFIFVFVFIRWLVEFRKSLNDYDNHFKHNDGHRNGGHIIKDSPKAKEEAMPAGIPNLPIFEDAPSAPPTMEEFKEHPRYAIIKGYMSSTSEALWRIGILEADNMLLEILKRKGYTGETVSDMLKESSFKTVDMAWDAHKIRNRIAHEGSDFELTEREAKRAFNLYESVFRELKAIK
ncbi:MAG: hypothetical protein JWN37_833 [Candidatus Nomurabacteria bacterium]|nr:hypothetical protein [Candidatus Nomurabacteria bacterium]